jgi:DNA replication protein DnaC
MAMKPKKTAKTTPNRREEVLTDFATLRIPVTAEQLDEALKQAQDAGLTHLDFLHRLLADQAGLRRERSLQRRIKCACFRDLKPLAEFDWNFNPAISRVQIETLAACDFVRRHQNLVFVGQSGVGKSHLIQSIGQAACTVGFKVHYITSGKLLEDLRVARRGVRATVRLLGGLFGAAMHAVRLAFQLHDRGAIYDAIQ